MPKDNRKIEEKTLNDKKVTQHLKRHVGWLQCSDHPLVPYLLYKWHNLLGRNNAPLKLIRELIGWRQTIQLHMNWRSPIVYGAATQRANQFVLAAGQRSLTIRPDL